MPTLIMKKANISLAFLAVFLVSCGGNGTSGSSVSSSASSSSSPSTSEPVAKGLVSQVASAASKYNGGKSEEAVASGAGLAVDSKRTYGNLVLLLQSAFSSALSETELTGQRKYGGVYSLPDSYIYTDPKVKTALEWMASYGLWGNDSFAQDDVPSVEEVNTILKRFFFYFGSSINDDFFATVNHDFLYENDDDASITPSSSFQAGRGLDPIKTEQNICDYAKEVAESSSSKEPFYTTALGYHDGTLDYSYLSDESFISDVAAIKAISSLTDWTELASSFFEEYGSNSLFALSEIKEGKNKNAALIFNVGLYPSFLQSALSLPTITAIFGYLGLNESEIPSLVDSYASLSNKAKAIYASDAYKIFVGQSANVCFEDGHDLFLDNGLSINLKDLLVNGGLTPEESYCVITKDSGALLSLGKALEEATSSELVALSLMEYVFSNKAAISYNKGVAGPYATFLTLIGNNLAYDYMASEQWQDSYDIMVDLFNGTKNAFSSRLDSSSWLSSEGKTILKDKLDAVTYTMVGKSSDSSVLSYKNRYIPGGLNLRKALAKANSLTVKDSLSVNAQKVTVDKIYMLAMGPFLANAFYASMTNSINITFGAIFSLGITLKGVSKEALYGKIGVIIGHEITHGFDSNGVLSDKDGNSIKDGIIPSSDMTAFNALTEQVIGLYRKEEALPGLIQDSRLTVTECLADIGGMAFMETLGEKDASFDYKKYYQEYADGMGSKITRSYYFLRGYSKDVHPYGRTRVNRLLSNSPKFISTFNIKEGDGMYLLTDQQVTVW